MGCCLSRKKSKAKRRRANHQHVVMFQNVPIPNYFEHAVVPNQDFTDPYQFGFSFPQISNFMATQQTTNDVVFPKPRSASSDAESFHSAFSSKNKFNSTNSKKAESSGSINGPAISGVAVFNYTAREDQEITIKQGEKLALFGDLQRNWVRAKLEGSRIGKIGYVPYTHVATLGTLKAQPWYFDDCRRCDVERALTSSQNSTGAFLIRSCSFSKAPYMLSVRNVKKVEHFKIHRDEKQQLYITKNLKFFSVEKVVSAYSAKQTPPVPLLKSPCKKLELPNTIGLCHYLEHTWEVPRHKISLVSKLGEGHFGEVYKGYWNNILVLAIKTLKKEKLSGYEFYEESEILKRLVHPKIVQFFGISTTGDPFYILTELMANGDLLSYLRKGDGKNLSEAKLIDMTIQVASGMAFLETNRFVHRDLAARNILVGEDNICKISDFGSTKIAPNGFYILRRTVQLPIKWSAPESISGYKFSHKTDVWSFGIFLVEVIEKGMEPYPGMNSTEIAEEVCTGYVMPQDYMPHCPDLLYKLMTRCWKLNDFDRPSFSTIVNWLEKFYDETENKIASVNSDEEYEYVSQKPSQSI